MDPQALTSPANAAAQWVNDAPSLDVSASRYNQIIHGGKPAEDSPLASFVPHSRY
jgi:hypothetical protein